MISHWYPFFLSRTLISVFTAILLLQSFVAGADGPDKAPGKVFVRISEGVNLTFNGLPAYLSDHPSDTPPHDSLFKEFENAEAAFLKLPARTGIWVRVTLVNHP
jgi:hypothetical protein